MKIWKVILATMVIFGAGIVVGGLLNRRAEPVNAPTARAGNPQNQNLGQFRLQQLLHRLERELALTAEQDQHIKKIIATSQDRTKEMMKPVTLEVNRVCDEIRDELTPEQKLKFDTIFKEHGERGERGGERGSHRRPVGGATNSNSFNLHTNDY